MSEDRLEAGRGYVVQLRQHGRSDREIGELLAASGWAEEDALELLAPSPPFTPGDRLAHWRVSFIKRLREQGMEDERIREGLEVAGWSQEDVGLLLSSPRPRRAAVLEGEPASQALTAAPPDPPPALTVSMVLIGSLFAIGALTGLGVLVLVARDVRTSGAPSGFPSQLGFQYAVAIMAIGAICLGTLALSYFAWRGDSLAHIPMLLLLGLLTAAFLPLGVLALPVIWVLCKKDSSDYRAAVCAYRVLTRPPDRRPPELKAGVPVSSVVIGPCLIALLKWCGPGGELQLLAGLIFVALLVLGHFLGRGDRWARVALVALMSALAAAAATWQWATGGHWVVGVLATTAALYAILLFAPRVKAYCGQRELVGTHGEADR
jgi:hypothetical protein